MLVASAALAAPVVDLDKGQSAIGYVYTPLDYDIKSHNYFFQTALHDKFILGVEGLRLSNGGSFTMTDFYVQYKLDKNFRLVAGGRDFDGYETKFVWGAAVKADLDKNAAFYAAYMHNPYWNEYQAGITYMFSKNAFLDLSYRRGEFEGVKLDGFGGGLVFRF